jgi:hypothetical protein
MGSNIRDEIVQLVRTKDPDRSMRPRVLGGEIAHLLTVRYPDLDGIAVMHYVAEVDANKRMIPEVLAAAVAEYFQLEEEAER